MIMNRCNELDPKYGVIVMSLVQTALPLIRPISDLRTNLNEVCDQAKSSQEPIFMTKNGKASLVVMDSQAYENQMQHLRITQKIREAEIEAKYNSETFSSDQVNKHLNEIFKHWEQ